MWEFLQWTFHVNATTARVAGLTVHATFLVKGRKAVHSPLSPVILAAMLAAGMFCGTVALFMWTGAV